MTHVGAWLERKAPAVHRFLTRRDRPWPVVREIGAGILGLVLLVALLYGTTAQPLGGGYPVVVVTSGSMMHCKQGPAVAWLGKDCDPTVYGRIGTIDPGDLVFVRHTSDAADIDTKAQAASSSHYGGDGDVVVYRPHRSGADLLSAGQATAPIIHRALLWVDVAPGASARFLDRAGGIELNQTVVANLAGCQVTDLRLDNSGLLTRGDNNLKADQCRDAFDFAPAGIAMILGKARGELPWIGLVKLWVDDLTHSSSDFNNAGGDSKVMLLLTVVVLVGTPMTLDVVARRRRRKKDADDAAKK